MRVLKECGDCVCAVPTCPPTTQHSSVEHVQQLWKEWEIQLLVLASFSLQVILLFSAAFRKRHSSRVLSALLWLSYLSADSIAVFVLGRLAAHTSDPQHQLVLFWAPFLLLHLGGQDTITAFSMEDCMLWKRHLLNFTIQVALAIYIVRKQWHGGSQLVAPMVLMFISGTIKYAERIRALRRAGSRSSSFNAGGRHLASGLSRYYDGLLSIISEKKEENFEHVMDVTCGGFFMKFDFLMDVNPPFSGIDLQDLRIAIAERIHRFDDGANDLVYKIVEIQLSLVHDYLYTKFGRVTGVLHRLITLVLTSTALVLFLEARVDHQLQGLVNYSRADVTISYILLVGAVTMEISSTFMWSLLSYWPYMPIAYWRTFDYDKIFHCVPKGLHPGSRMEWPGKMKQYNMLDGCIQEIQAGRLERIMGSIGIKRDYTTHVVISPEVKKVLLVKLLEIKTNAPGGGGLSSSSFRGQWSQWWAALQTKDYLGAGQQSESAAQRALQLSNIQGLAFVSSVYLWHMVTDICLVADKTASASEFRSFSQALSNYMMYLVAKRNVMLDSCAYHVLHKSRHSLLCTRPAIVADRSAFLQKVYHGVYHGTRALDQAREVSLELLRPEGAAYRWELIATVWVDMLCYIARNCGAEFHAKHLITGGEFVSHVKIVLVVLGFSFHEYEEVELA
ncbi:hypothetical protein CFC21_044466 [Triticum aestivum]|uniref:DUF4220 domain-containing protein n=2 Tax=Triticum aestivum TaxID=4565 RepID=A0A3B6G152_WHEAT|nr:uncharacterized protein LOC123066720 [Triticum aestivum]KAF7033359.1 hypothetical protein CFC21_044466 [Triticum aestivum]